MSLQGLARHSIASSSAALHSTASHNMANSSAALHSTASHSLADSSIALHSAASTSTAECSTASHGTAEHSTARCGMARSSTALHSTAESSSTHSETGSTHNSKPVDKLKQVKHIKHSTVNVDTALQAPAHATEAEVRTWYYKCNKVNTELQAKVNKLQEMVNHLSADRHTAEH